MPTPVLVEFIVLAAVWGASFLFMRLSVDDFGAVPLAAVRVAIAAAVLGGFSLRGGEGSIVGVVLGAVLLQVLQNLVNLLGIPSSLNFAVMGSVILVGVIADMQFDNYRQRRALRAQEEARATAVAAARTPLPPPTPLVCRS